MKPSSAAPSESRHADESRERFEKSQLGQSLDLSLAASGQYRKVSANYALMGWQAAEQDTLERCAQLCEQEAKARYETGLVWQSDCAGALMNVAERIRGKGAT
ncbi:MAG TPA: hypothetical protein VFX22_01725 [Candidatus Kapabacteria bacterium]|nr:hypothetical protein [Candidatus Kapabacteria bacterium]